MIELMSSPEAWISLLTLVALEIVLGIDNIVFISILSGKLPQEQQYSARRWGLALALITRLMLLSALSWIAKLTTPLFTVMNHGVSGRDLILLLGGLFLMVKATYEIYDKVEAAHDHHGPGGPKRASYGLVLFQIMLLDVVFSLDSVITAIGMVKHLEIMVAAVIISIIVMMIFAGPVGDFVERHPSMKILALSFLVMIGILLFAEGLHHHFNKGFVYFGMAFSLSIELLNMRFRKRASSLQNAVSPLHESA